MLAIGCGRIGFDDHAASGDAAPALGDATTALPIAWRRTLVAINQLTAASTDTFTVTPVATGDAVVVHTTCPSGFPPTAVTLSAPGWSFAQIGPITGNTTAGLWTSSFGATAPSTAAATWTVQWTDSSACGTLITIADEFANVGHTGGAITFDAHDEAVGSSDCVTSLTTGYDAEALWGACTSRTALVAVEAGYTKAGDDGSGDWSEYRIASDPAGTDEQITFTNATGTYFAITAVSLRAL
jgi:hypothetical protein